MNRMNRIVVASTAILGFSTFGLGFAAQASAAPNPSVTGPPNQTCQVIEALPGGMAPGNASSSRGSVFNEPILNSQLGGVGGQRYNAVGAPSQYDVACFQVSQPH
jgi:hypothetical protein